MINRELNKIFKSDLGQGFIKFWMRFLCSVLADNFMPLKPQNKIISTSTRNTFLGKRKHFYLLEKYFFIRHQMITSKINSPKILTKNFEIHYSKKNFRKKWSHKIRHYNFTEPKIFVNGTFLVCENRARYFKIYQIMDQLGKIYLYQS